MAKATKKCPLCKEREIERRGACRPCYEAARRRIRAGKTTDEQLVALGVLQPKKTAGRRASGGAAVIDKLLGK